MKSSLSWYVPVSGACFTHWQGIRILATAVVYFISRASRMCTLWRDTTLHSSLWSQVDLSYGWIKTTEQTLAWLAENRLSRCREINLSTWKNLTNTGLKVEVVMITLCGRVMLNTLRPRQSGCHFADDTVECIFLNENVRISIKISLEFVPECPINNIPALVQLMAWRRPGNKPLSEPMMVRLSIHICITRPQWVKCIRELDCH